MGITTELSSEIIGHVLDYLSVPDLCRSARVSLLFKDLVYEEIRWINKLKTIGVWSDEAARQNQEEEAFRRQEKINGKKTAKTNKDPPNKSQNLLELGSSDLSREKTNSAGASGNLDPKNRTNVRTSSNDERSESDVLTVIRNVRCIPGQARQEFARVWKFLFPLYSDLVHAQNPSDPILFRRFRLPEDQARMLNQLRTFARTPLTYESETDNIKLYSMIDLFQNAAVREFEISYDNRDESSMKRYANVLELLDGGDSCLKAFCRKHQLFTAPPPNPFDCFDSFSDDSRVNLAPMGALVDSLATELRSQRELISRIFTAHERAWKVFIEQIFSHLLHDYVNKLIDYAQQQSPTAYLLAFTGSYQHLAQLVIKLSDSPNPPEKRVTERVKGVIKPSVTETHADPFLTRLLQKLYEQHVSYYLEEELAQIRHNVVKEVVKWDKEIKNESEQTEQLFLSGINREVAKKNFLQSFTKVILMPVNVVGSVMPFPAKPTVVSDNSQSAAVIAGRNEIEDKRASELPTTELAARAAIMNSGLARIKRLLSLEVALQLIHVCKEAIDRARSFVTFSGRTGEEAREQCETMFSIMIQSLGTRHIQIGFDLALESLKSFNPRKNREIAEVQPLVDFLELVHVGDLMQQMIDVFYNQELSGIVDKTDFLSPAVKEKKKFEQMIDEKVAEGLNRGIDVLIEQIDYLLVTTQQPTDFKPWLVLGKDDHLDLRESETAKGVVECLKTHTELLRGSTDKSTLDVFFQEVGVRFFGSLCKHFKRQTITVEGGLKLISDLNYYHAFVSSLRQPSIMPYFDALKELGNIYIISGRDGKAVGQVISDIARFGGVLRPEDVYEFAERRADWQKVKRHVDGVIYGTRLTEDCIVS